MSKAMDALEVLEIQTATARNILRDYITTTEAEAAKGVLAIEIDRGVEGLSLSIMSYENNKKESGVGERLDGPKPWGGGRALYSCTVDKVMAEQILEEIYRTYPDAQPKIDCRPQTSDQAARIKELEEALVEKDAAVILPPDAKEAGPGKYMNLWKCPKCGGNTNTYRHPYAKVWCESCGHILREEGDQTIIHREENPMRGDARKVGA